MNRRYSPIALLAALALLLTVNVTAQTLATANLPKPEELERSLKGVWVGALEYRDYQSNQKFELPMTTTIEVGADNATITRVSAFDDGPKTGVVYITTVSLYDPTGARMAQSTFRKGRAVETWTERVEVKSFADLSNWTMTYSRTGTDGNSTSDIRLTTTRKEVKTPNAPESTYATRNQTRLQKK
jgi:hypothetical protein